MTDFRALIATLANAAVEFILIDGVAATVHGSARLTQDLDVVYARNDENLQRLVAAVAPHGPYLREAPPGLAFNLDVATLKSGLNFTLSTALGDLDLLGEVTGVAATRICGHGRSKSRSSARNVNVWTCRPSST